MTAAEEFLRTLKLDIGSIQYLDVSLVNRTRGLHVTIRPGYPEMRVRQVCREFVKHVTPKTPEDVRELGRWLDMGE